MMGVQQQQGLSRLSSSRSSSRQQQHQLGNSSSSRRQQAVDSRHVVLLLLQVQVHKLALTYRAARSSWVWQAWRCHWWTRQAVHTRAETAWLTC